MQVQVTVNVKNWQRILSQDIKPGSKNARRLYGFASLQVLILLDVFT